MSLRALLPCLLAALPLAARGADDVEALKKRVAELEQEVIELKSRSVPISALVGDDITVNCWRPMEKGHLGKPIRDLLSLSNDDAKSIDAAVARARAAVAATVAAQHPQPKIVDGTLTLELAPFVEEGKKAKEAYRQALLDVLGRDRAKLFEKLAQNSLDESLLSFGEGTYVFTITPEGNGFRTKIEQRAGGGRRSSTTSSGGGLDDEFEAVKPYIPLEFGGTAGVPAAEPPEPPPARPAGPKGRDGF